MGETMINMKLKNFNSNFIAHEFYGGENYRVGRRRIENGPIVVHICGMDSIEVGEDSENHSFPLVENVSAPLWLGGR